VYLGADRDSWHLEEDSSIVHRGGVELISPILRGFEGLVESYRFFQLLNEIRGVRIDESCGFHVHHGVDTEHYKCIHLRELVRVVHAMEDYIYLLISEGRIDRDTCRPMDLDIEVFLSLLTVRMDVKKMDAKSRSSGILRRTGTILIV